MTTAIKVTPAGEITTIHVAELADYQREIGGWIAELRLTNGHALLVDEEAACRLRPSRDQPRSARLQHCRAPRLRNAQPRQHHADRSSL